MPLALQHRHDPIKDKKSHDDNAVFNSSNWSGYSLIGPNGSVTNAYGEWTVPAVSCSSGNQYSSFWVGIDGFNSSTVEQTGTDSDCNGSTPTYYAWYEFYPHASFLITTTGIGAIGPGTHISATIQYNAAAGTYTVTLKNFNSGKAFSTTQAMSASRSSAEWIAEAPSSGGVLPIANFSPATFFNNAATFNGSNGSLASYLPAGCSNGSCNPSQSSGVQQVDLVQSSGATATPGNINSSDSSFTVTASVPAAPPKKHGRG